MQFQSLDGSSCHSFYYINIYAIFTTEVYADMHFALYGFCISRLPGKSIYCVTLLSLTKLTISLELLVLLERYTEADNIATYTFRSVYSMLKYLDWNGWRIRDCFIYVPGSSSEKYISLKYLEHHLHGSFYSILEQQREGIFFKSHSFLYIL